MLDVELRHLRELEPVTHRVRRTGDGSHQRQNIYLQPMGHVLAGDFMNDGPPQISAIQALYCAHELRVQK